MSDRQIAERINRDGVTALMDLNGWSGGMRTGVIAERPAPVQVNYKNWVASAGMPNLHYIVGDAVATPPEFQSDFTEGEVFPLFSAACIHSPDVVLCEVTVGVAMMVMRREGCCGHTKNVAVFMTIFGRLCRNGSGSQQLLHIRAQVSVSAVE
jgi:hypothetical protein